MKKINTEALEKMAKEKNIDKDKIEQIADSYKGKSEGELMDELIKIGQTLKGRDEVVSKFKTFLDEEQRNKLDVIMKKISDAEIENKINAKKSKTKKGPESSANETKSSKSSKKTKSSKNKISSPNESSSPTHPKKVVKKVKKTKRP
ncbi:hypothetical protein [Romboutsia sp. 1001713B170131_170501_G6]|uniref:hypothetical protein n=1 Tax=Romboutsia sp. 1001713B170131_170501_G6 TaxID=2787108 RepID=UPI0018AB2A17|nr:hypothetical protein [Romboutsia sp. 1001713B170131_170501_G6]